VEVAGLEHRLEHGGTAAKAGLDAR
jgi:hypothetical protein